MGAAEVVQQLLVGRSLFQCVELAAVQVLQECVTEQVIVVRVLDDGRNDGQSGGLGGSPATFTHDQLELWLLDPVRALTCSAGQLLRRDGPHDHGLQHPDLTDRVDQLSHLVITEGFAWLLRIRPDGEHRELRITSPRDGRQVHHRRRGCGVRPSSPFRSDRSLFHVKQKATHPAGRLRCP